MVETKSAGAMLPSIISIILLNDEIVNVYFLKPIL